MLACLLAQVCVDTVNRLSMIDDTARSPKLVSQCSVATAAAAAAGDAFRPWLTE